MRRIHRKKFYRDLTDFYNDYKGIDTPGEEKLTLRKYKKFIAVFFRLCFKKIMTTKFHLTMPFGLGDFYLKEMKPSGWFKKKSNPHTHGKCFKFKWDPTYAIFDNLRYIDFKKNYYYAGKLKRFYKLVAFGHERSPEPYSYPVEKFTDLG